MQGSISLLVLSVVAGAALATARGVTGAGAYPSAGAGIRGVTRTSAGASGDLVPVDTIGTTLMESGGTVTLNGPVKCDATGRAIDQGGTGTIVGYALSAAGAAGVMVEVVLVGRHRLIATHPLNF
jgi:hypothetical protein